MSCVTLDNYGLPPRRKIPTSKHSETRKLKKEFHVPGKRRPTSKQIFANSDRISYGFNKLEPFKVGPVKSISQAISEAHKPNDGTERKYIKANNYYSHNFLMSKKNCKNSLLSFRLTEILKEKRQLKQKILTQLNKYD